MGNISVDGFLREYSVAAKQKGSAMEMFINKHITTKYISIIKKDVICDSIIKTTCFKKDGDKEIIKINSVSRYLFFVMKLIELYTDIDINKEDVINDYDKLNEAGAINTLIASIPESEYSEFSTIINMKLDDLRDNEYSLTALFYNLKQSLTISEETINSIIEELNKNE